MKWWIFSVGVIFAVALGGLLLTSTRVRLASTANYRFGSITPPQLFAGSQFALTAAQVNASRLIYDDFDAITLIAPGSPSTPINVHLLTLVPSRVENSLGRDAIRQSYGSVRLVDGKAVRTVFLVGRSDSTAVGEAVRKESVRFGDIVQFDFADTYRNLTLKTILGLRWATTTGHDSGYRAKYLLKADEDVLVNYDRLVAYLSGARLNRLYAGYVWRGAPPIRDPTNKYFVSVEEYAGERYPDYAAGPCYVLSSDGARLVVEQAPNLPFLTMEDVFVGICADRAGIKATPNYQFGNDLAREYDYCKFRNMITVHGVNASWKLLYWRDRTVKLLQRGTPNC